MRRTTRRIGPSGPVAIALALAVWSQACSVYRPPPAGRPQQDRRVRVRSVVPFVLAQQQPAGALTSVAACRATAAEGLVLGVVGDTLVLQHLRGVTSAPAPDGTRQRCPEGETVALVRTPETRVTQRQVHWGRTGGLALGAVAALAAIIALGVGESGGGY